MVTMFLRGITFNYNLNAANQKAYEVGTFLVAVVENKGNNENSYPASSQWVIRVGAVDCNGNHESFSQYNDGGHGEEHNSGRRVRLPHRHVHGHASRCWRRRPDLDVLLQLNQPPNLLGTAHVGVEPRR